MNVRVFTMSLVLALLAGVAWADWDPNNPDNPLQSTNHKMHYPQLPNLTQLGLDVLDGPYSSPQLPNFYEKFLADDWRCSQSGPVTDIHFWGSYNFDMVIGPNTAFSLVIFEDIPASASPTGYSMPGKPLWSWYGPPTAVRRYAPAIEEFLDPNQQEIIGSDTTVWQFNFQFDPSESFFQQRGQIYWLGVKHTFDLDGDGIVGNIDLSLLQEQYPGLYGWKTSGSPHFNDDAVWIDVNTFGGDPHVVPGGAAGLVWNELRDPRTGESLDLAFVITPEPATLGLLALGGLVAMRRRRI